MSAPRAPKATHTSRCSSAGTLTANRPARRITGQVLECLPGQNKTSGGSRDNAANDWQAKPAGLTSSCVVTTGDAGAEMAEHGPEAGLVDHLNGHCMPTLKS